MRLMPRSNPVARVEIRLPAALLSEVDRVRRKTGESRSAVIGRSVELLLSRARHAEMVRQYVAGYVAHPERRTEVDACVASAAPALAEELWE